MCLGAGSQTSPFPQCFRGKRKTELAHTQQHWHSTRCEEAVPASSGPRRFYPTVSVRVSSERPSSPRSPLIDGPLGGTSVPPPQVSGVPLTSSPEAKPDPSLGRDPDGRRALVPGAAELDGSPGHGLQGWAGCGVLPKDLGVLPALPDRAPPCERLLLTRGGYRCDLQGRAALGDPTQLAAAQAGGPSGPRGARRGLPLRTRFCRIRRQSDEVKAPHLGFPSGGGWELKRSPRPGAGGVTHETVQ